MWLMHPGKFNLSHQDEQYYEDLRMCYVTMCNNIVESEAVRILQSIMPEKRNAHIYSLMNDCESLFGQFRKMNKDFQRSLMRERLKKLIEFLSKEEYLPESDKTSKKGNPIGFNNNAFFDDEDEEEGDDTDTPVQKNRKPKDWVKQLLNAELLLMKLDKLDQSDNQDTFDWTTLQIPEVTYTSDKKYLSQNIEDAQEEE